MNTNNTIAAKAIETSWGNRPLATAITSLKRTDAKKPIAKVALPKQKKQIQAVESYKDKCKDITLYKVVCVHKAYEGSYKVNDYFIVENTSQSHKDFVCAQKISFKELENGDLPLIAEKMPFKQMVLSSNLIEVGHVKANKMHIRGGDNKSLRKIKTLYSVIKRTA